MITLFDIAKHPKCLISGLSATNLNLKAVSRVIREFIVQTGTFLRGKGVLLIITLEQQAYT